MAEITTFPQRQDAEETYNLTADYKRLFDTVLDYAKERVLDTDGNQRSQRVAWWSALALLRSLASSPAAAAATLRARSNTADTETADEADAVGERAVLDLEDAESSEFMDVAPGGQEGEEQPQSQRERLLRFARRAEELYGPQADTKLNKAITLVKKLLADGYNPILFCRFIPTADYVAAQLRSALPGKVEVVAITGLLPPTERELRVEQMGQYPQRVLVATDCLSEGINLQAYFNAVVHYDLSWNPTRHEQREGRVDRFGQPSTTVRTVTYYGTDNQIDGIVLDVLLRKHKAIRTSLGISVPLPANTSEVIQALMNGLLLRGGQISPHQLVLPFMNDMTVTDLQLDWENVSDREKQSRTLFAQRALKVDEVAKEWQAMRVAIGTAVDVERFVTEVVKAHQGYVTPRPEGLEVTLPNKQALIDSCGGLQTFTARFTLPVTDKVRYLSRTHPLVEGLAAYTMDTALDPLQEGVAKRCGVIRTRDVTTRTVLLLLRFRYHLTTHYGQAEVPLLAEACEVAAFRGRTQAPEWLSGEEAEALLQAQPGANITPEQAGAQIQRLLADLAPLRPALTELAEARSQALLEAHRRVRLASGQKGVRHTVRPQLPADILGVYILLPVVN
jgi:hypothetical protein